MARFHSSPNLSKGDPQASANAFGTSHASSPERRSAEIRRGRPLSPQSPDGIHAVRIAGTRGVLPGRRTGWRVCGHTEATTSASEEIDRMIRAWGRDAILHVDEIK
jgi:hypothetical protein